MGNESGDIQLDLYDRCHDQKTRGFKTATFFDSLLWLS